MSKQTGKIRIEFGIHEDNLMFMIRDRYEEGWTLQAMASTQRKYYTLVFVKIGDPNE